LKRGVFRLAVLFAGIAAGAGIAVPAAPSETLIGPAAYGDWRGDAPGVRRLIRPADLLPPFITTSASNGGRVAPLPPGFLPKVPPGFKVSVFADGLNTPRMVRVAPNGDIFVAESGSGRIRLLRAPDGADQAASNTIFASGLGYAHGIAFYPPGPNPQYVYIANTDSVTRFRYALGDSKIEGGREVLVSGIPGGGHVTRDVVFSPDGNTMFVSVGSGSNDADSVRPMGQADLAAYEQAHGLGAIWGTEEGRADVLAFDPNGGHRRVFATGLRNCVSMAIQPVSNDLWCAVNERDGFGDNLPPDYATRVREGAFYGWPWYYIGNNEDPRHRGERPDLAGKVTVPDVLIQPHSAPLGIAFYTGTQFPPEYRGDAFVTLQGSWNRAKRTGNKVIRLIMKDGKPTGEYEDFLTGLNIADDAMLGRPVTVAMARDGALLVTDEGAGVIWRIAAEAR
jgi:glucose/arabinose dehydrogenase